MSAPTFIWPDPITDASQISGATFLYFDGPIILTQTPVIYPLDYSPFPRLVELRNPSWRNTFEKQFYSWIQMKHLSNTTVDLFKPLKKILVCMLKYSASSRAIDEMSSFYEMLGINFDELKLSCNQYNAYGEFMRHLLFEKYYEYDEDWEKVYRYYDEIVHQKVVEKLLVKSYFLRLFVFKDFIKANARILLTNQNLITLFSKMSIHMQPIQTGQNIDIDIVEWELFRQILSPRLDPLDKEKIDFIIELLNEHGPEIQRFRLKCHQLAQELTIPDNLENLPVYVEKFIRQNVEHEIGDVLMLDRRDTDRFLENLFSDRMAWAGITTFLRGVVQEQQQLFTVGGLILAIATIGATAVRTLVARNEKISQNDFALVYRIAKNI